MTLGSQAQSPDEWFDVVDAEDRVVGRAIRSEVHRRGLFHRAVHLLVENGAGQIFLQKRSRWKDSAPGQWSSSASGHVDAGEDYVLAVLREAHEELGMVLQQMPREVARAEPCAETGNEFVRVFRERSEGPFVLPPAEVETGDWFSPAEIDAWIERAPGELAESFRFLWARARTAFGRR